MSKFKKNLISKFLSFKIRKKNLKNLKFELMYTYIISSKFF